MTQIPDNAAAEASFDFVTDERFRDSLHSDYGELLKSLQNRAWKATHVLAGSVIEALLVDYLIFLDYKKRHGKDPLMFDLATAVDACRTEGVISERSAQLSTVVRGFRNLIHPGRVIRLEEKINQSTADVAKALVDIIVEEVAAARKTKYGLTAAQIIVKLEKDSTVLPILGHLLRETNEREKEHLALDLIPKKHLEHRDDTSYPLAALETCFHQLFEMLPDDARKLVARRFVTILKEQPDTDVLDYENAFFRAGQLKYLTDDEQGLVKKHLLSQIKGPKIPAHKLSAFAGMGKFISSAEAKLIFVHLFAAAVAHDDDSVKKMARGTVNSEYFNLPNEDAKKSARKAGEAVAKLYESRGLTEAAQEIRSLVTEVQEEIPF